MWQKFFAVRWNPVRFWLNKYWVILEKTNLACEDLR
jgi:hypothetical protein